VAATHVTIEDGKSDSAGGRIVNSLAQCSEVGQGLIAQPMPVPASASVHFH
jgi:hypothetical protein